MWSRRRGRMSDEEGPNYIYREKKSRGYTGERNSRGSE